MADRLLIGRFPGPAGQAATVQIGTVTEGPAGVTNIGTTRDAILDFSIPKPRLSVGLPFVCFSGIDPPL